MRDYDISVDINWDKNVFKSIKDQNDYICQGFKGVYYKEYKEVQMKPFKGHVSECNNQGIVRYQFDSFSKCDMFKRHIV